MTLPSSGSISMSDIRTEFGGSAPDSISEYYSADTGVPASGAISMSDFYGTSASVTVAFNASSYVGSDSESSGAVAQTSIVVNNNGTISGTGDTSPSGEWTPDTKASGNGNPFQIRLTVNSGTPPSGNTVGSWLALTSNKTWNISAFNTTVSGNYTIAIRNATTLTIEDTATVILSATSSGSIE